MDLQIKTSAVLFSIDKVLIKAGKRIRHSSEDTLLDFWIGVADAYIEKETNLALMEQTLVLRLRRVLPTVQLPRPPLKTITHVKFTIDGVETVLGEADIVKRKENMLPTLDLGISEADGTMEIEYVSGAATPEEVPADIRQAAFLLASHYVSSREAEYLDPRIMMIEKKISFGVDQLLRNHRIPNVNDTLNGGW